MGHPAFVADRERGNLLYLVGKEKAGWVVLAERGGFEPPVEVLAPTTV
jgi:hypothetical protein